MCYVVLCVAKKPLCVIKMFLCDMTQFPCENRINSCDNRTCTLNGYCFQNETASLCKCFSDFYGDECELEKSAIKIQKGVQFTSLILCLLFVGFTIITILANDAVNLLMQKSYRSKQSEIKIKRSNMK